VLKLRYRDKDYVRRRDSDSITLGRDENCGIHVHDDQASRHHCTIEAPPGQIRPYRPQHQRHLRKRAPAPTDVLVQREEFVLTGKGTLTCGQPAVSTKEIVEYSVLTT